MAANISLSLSLSCWIHGFVTLLAAAPPSLHAAPSSLLARQRPAAPTAKPEKKEGPKQSLNVRTYVADSRTYVFVKERNGWRILVVVFVYVAFLDVALPDAVSASVIPWRRYKHGLTHSALRFAMLYSRTLSMPRRICGAQLGPGSKQGPKPTYSIRSSFGGATAWIPVKSGLTSAVLPGASCASVIPWRLPLFFPPALLPALRPPSFSLAPASALVGKLGVGLDAIACKLDL